MTNVHVICFLASYTVAFVLEWTRLLGKRSIHWGLTLLFGGAGFAAHTLYLLERSRQTDLPPLLSSPHDWLLVLAWLAIVFYLFLTAVDRNLPIGLFLLPLVLLLTGASYLVSDAGSAEITAQRGWKMLHASLLVFGIAGVLTGVVLSMMYLVQHWRLKHKQSPHAGLVLPNLEKLARLNWWAVVVSVPLLTLGLATGVGLGWYARQAAEPVSFWDPVVLGSGVAWLVMVVFFAWLLQARHPVGKQIAWLTLWSCGFLLITLIGLQVLTGRGPLESWHGTPVPSVVPFVGL